METGLDGHVALVTGGSGAIGAAVAGALAAEGARVAVTYRGNRAAADAVVEKIAAAGGAARAIRYDMAGGDPTSGTGDPGGAAAGLLDEVAETLGPPAVVVANAVVWPTFGGGEVDGLRASLEANTAGTVAVVDAALPAMRDAGWGRVVVVSTDIVDQPMPGPLAYAGAKGGLEAAVRVLAVREARHGILTNTVRPGFTLTDRARHDPRFGEEVIRAESDRTPSGRICTPDDVASAVTYLGSAANGHVNGQIVSVAGGRELVR